MSLISTPLVTAFILFVGFQSSAMAAPKVVVSIAPIHSLVAGVMEGVAEPELLVNGGGSPHTYMMKPSQMRSLQRADLVVWVGENVESFLPRALVTLSNKTDQLELKDQPGMVLLDSREGGMWELHKDDHHDHDHHQHHQENDQHDHGEVDGHLWLDPENAKAIVKVVVESLSERDPPNASRYQINADHLIKKLAELDGELKQKLAQVRDVPYLVFHDGYQYLEAHFGLNAIGSVTVDPERKPGARRLKEIRQKVRDHNAKCVFSEPQFSDSVTRVVTEGSTLKTATLDPMGSDLTVGPELYFQLMRDMAGNLVDCLE